MRITGRTNDSVSRSSFSAQGNWISLMSVWFCPEYPNLQLIGDRFQDVSDTPDSINTQYVIVKELGKGAYGTVYLAEDAKTHQK